MIWSDDREPSEESSEFLAPRPLFVALEGDEPRGHEVEPMSST